MDYTTAVTNLSDALVKQHLANGGLLSLTWEELNEHLDRDTSSYKKVHARELSNSLTAYLQPYLDKSDMELLEVELANCGLCITIPPITKELVEGVMEVLSNTLTQEDIEALEWDVCNEDGTSYW